MKNCSHYQLKPVATVILCILLTLGPSKSRADVIDWIIGDTIQAILDTTLSYLDQTSHSWQGLLTETINKLEDAGHDLVARDLKSVLETAVQDVGMEAKCTVDFIRKRVIADVQGLLAKWTGRAVLLNPDFCQPNPTSLNAKDAALGHIPTLDISGYFLYKDRLVNEGRISAVLVSQGGGETNIVNHLANPSPYLLTLNLGSNGLRLNSNSKLIKFVIDGQERTVQVYQPPTEKHTAVLENIGGNGFCPPHTRGDKEFKGHGPNVWTSVKLYQKGSNELYARVYIKAEEDRSNWTTAEGAQDYWVWRAPPNKAIIGFQPDYSEDYYKDNGHSEVSRSPSNGGPVYQFITKGDTKGNDVGNCTGDDVYLKVLFNPIEVTLKDVF